jgi:hypothetical protein
LESLAFVIPFQADGKYDDRGQTSEGSSTVSGDGPLQLRGERDAQSESSRSRYPMDFSTDEFRSVNVYSSKRTSMIIAITAVAIIAIAAATTTWAFLQPGYAPATLSSRPIRPSDSLTIFNVPL